MNRFKKFATRFTSVLLATLIIAPTSNVVKADIVKRDTSIIYPVSSGIDFDGCVEAIASALINKTYVVCTSGSDAGMYEINISTYNIPPYASDDKPSIGDVWNEVYRRYPEIYYMSNYMTYYYKGSYITRLRIKPSISEAEQVQVEQKVSYIISLIDPSWSDVEKALFVHDYLATHTKYYNSGADHDHDAYGCLVLESCVCEGYAKAYDLLMNRLGIPTEVVISEKMNHAWNEILINGSWYNVDVTFDDPVSDCLGRVRHEYFMKSDSDFANLKTPHYGYLNGNGCNSTTYDNYWWTSVDSAIGIGADNYYYVSAGSNISVFERSRTNNNVVTEVLKNLRNMYSIGGGSYYLYPTYSTYVNGKLYYFLCNNVYEFDPTTGIVKIIYSFDAATTIRQMVVMENGNAKIIMNNDSKVYEVDLFSTPEIVVTCTPTPIPTATSTPVPTATPVPTVNATSTPTPTGKLTPTPTGELTPSSTPVPTATSTPVPTATEIPEPTVTPEPITTSTPIPTITTVPTNTPTPSPKLTGWQKIDNLWFYYKTDGSIATGWLKDGSYWYYMGTSGAMTTGWQLINNEWYYLGTSGQMFAGGWKSIGNVWYYFDSSGIMARGWKQIGNAWYYFKSSGEMVSGWNRIGDKWYYFNSGGAMVTGWLKLGTAWYYFKNDGSMATGWLAIGNKTYYFDSSGAMAVNRWIGNYYVDSSGVWTKTR